MLPTRFALSSRARLAALVLLAASSAACGGGLLASADRASNAYARVANRVQRLTVQVYETHKEAAIVEVAQRGGTREEAERALNAVRARWQPVWDALLAVAATHAAFVATLEAYRASGEDEAQAMSIIEGIAKMREAWSAARDAVCDVVGEGEMQAICGADAN